MLEIEKFTFCLYLLILDTEDFASSTKVEHHFNLQTKLDLIKKIRAVNKRKFSSYKIALKYLDWTQINVEGYKISDLKACFCEIIKPLSTIRTLEEMISDYENNHVKYDLKMHPDNPKLPKNAVMKYIDDNRVKLTKKLKNENPGINVGLVSYFWTLHLMTCFNCIYILFMQNYRKK